MRFHSSILVPLTLIAFSILLFIGAAGCKENDSAGGSAESKGSDCVALADALGMPRSGEPRYLTTVTGYMFSQGELSCIYDKDSNMRSIVSGEAVTEQGSETALVSDPNDAMRIATETLQKIERSTEGRTRVLPDTPWDDGMRSVSVIWEPDAYGYKTNGFAGRLEVEINRYTGKVISVNFLAERTPASPNVQLTEQDALRIAEELWLRSDAFAENAIPKTTLQYFAPVGSGKTSKGQELESQRILRMCWVVAYWIDHAIGSEDSSARKALAVIAIDAETGDVLKVPG